MEILVAAVVLGLVPAVIAARKGRNFLVWWLFGSSLLPIALPVSVLAGKGSSRRAGKKGRPHRCPKYPDLIRPHSLICAECPMDTPS